MHIPYIPNTQDHKADAWLTMLSKAMPQHRVRYLSDFSAAEKNQCNVAIVANPKHNEILQLPNLKWLHSTWAGVEQLVQNSALADLPVVRLQDPALAHHMAKTVLSWILNCHLNLPLYLQQQQQQIWQSHPVMEASALKVTILGAGNMAKTSASLLMANGYSVSMWGRSARAEMKNYYHGCQGLQKAVTNAEVVVVLLPMTKETRHLVNQAFLNWLRPSCCLLNFARGDIVDNQALSWALDNNALGHAVLDVFSTEPLPVADKFWRHPKVTVLPHVAAPTNPDTACRIIARNIAKYCATGQIPEAIDKSRGY